MKHVDNNEVDGEALARLIGVLMSTLDSYELDLVAETFAEHVDEARVIGDFFCELVQQERVLREDKLELLEMLVLELGS